MSAGGAGRGAGGSGQWRLERVAGVLLAPLLAWLVLQLMTMPVADFATLSGWIGSGWHPIAVALAVLLAVLHAWLGVEVVIDDYVHGPARRVALAASSLLHALVALTALYALLHLTTSRGH